MELIEQLRSYKMNGYALFDMVVTFLGMYLVAVQMKLDVQGMLALALPLGVVVHYILNVDTKMTREVMGEGNHLLKLYLLALLSYGVYRLQYGGQPGSFDLMALLDKISKN